MCCITGADFDKYDADLHAADEEQVPDTLHGTLHSASRSQRTYVSLSICACAFVSQVRYAFISQEARQGLREQLLATLSIINELDAAGGGPRGGPPGGEPPAPAPITRGLITLPA